MQQLRVPEMQRSTAPPGSGCWRRTVRRKKARHEKQHRPPKWMWCGAGAPHTRHSWLGTAGTFLKRAPSETGCCWDGLASGGSKTVAFPAFSAFLEIKMFLMFFYSVWRIYVMCWYGSGSADPCASDKWIRLWIRLLLFSIHLHHFSNIKSQEEVEIKVFLTFLAYW